ncbi:hypothetical protein V1J52_02470 [Streptomyces sp. TRM 70351]|uniref:hypothetical protein n=1 Tax=Streptomyces sp. TRM 70351 TaxID=3116552 RepID=UPI002E7BE453|nr:hypothetical protein [Streptomyces sp. TRM 70351]MEE1927055.1 hypothetical protein [Streptomyces sp. TRM 70351]
MNRRITSAVALAAAAVLSAAGCSSSEGGGGGGAGPAGELVTWAGDVCGHLHDGGRQLTMPEVDPGDAPAARDSAASFLDALSGQLGTLAENLRKEGPPPVSSAEDTYDAAMKALAETRKSVESAHTTLSQTEVEDPESLQDAFAEAGRSMGRAAAYEGPAEDLRKDPGLNAAFEEAPACRELDQDASPAPSAG